MQMNAAKVTLQIKVLLSSSIVNQNQKITGRIKSQGLHVNKMIFIKLVLYKTEILGIEADALAIEAMWPNK